MDENTRKLNNQLANVVINGESIEKAEQLIKRGADVNTIFSEKVNGSFDTSNTAEWSMLDIAVRYNNIRMAQLLLEKGANPNSGRWYPVRHVWDMAAGLDVWCLPPYISKERIFYCVLSEAIWNTKNIDMVRLLLSYGADPNYKYISSVVQPHPEHPGWVPRVYSRKTYSGMTDALLYSGDNMFVEELLNAGADPNTRYSYSVDCFDEIAYYGAPVLDMAIMKNNTKAVQLLLQKGASLIEEFCWQTERNEKYRRSVILARRPYDCNESIKELLRPLGWRKPFFWNYLATYPM